MQRICFMGTPQFACAILDRLCEEGYQPVVVVSQPDKKTGRKQEVTMTPVKACALAHGIEVVQPENIKECVEWIQSLNLDLIVTCAYGQFIPDAILNAPRAGSVNVHASILPKLRGGAPIHKAIITGEKESGVSIMRMVKKMDAGAVCHVKKVTIEENDTMGSLHDKLMQCGADALMDVLEDILQQKAQFIEQDESQATFAYNISKEEEKIDLSKDAFVVYNQIRGLIPSPVGYVLCEGKKMKLHDVALAHKRSNGAIGEIIGFEQDAMLVCLKDDTLLVKALQMEGKQKVSAKDFSHGAGRNLIGKCLN